MNVLLTGVAGFIGFHLAKVLLKSGHNVVGLDSFNEYYDVNLKHGRIKCLKELIDSNEVDNIGSLEVLKADISVISDVIKAFELQKPDVVINLAAQAGVRYSIDHPEEYVKSNLIGFGNILECCKDNGVNHLLYASSSSVYGGNEHLPFCELDRTDQPLSMYAATKKSNELMAYAYSNLFSLPTTGLRFFTAYGPWGRPDMALFLFTKAILEGKPINVFNNGNMRRDFTYIEDLVHSIYLLIDKPPVPKKANLNSAEHIKVPHRVLNIGNSNPTNLIEFIDEIESALGIKAIKNFMPLQDGDVPETSADTTKLQALIHYRPSTSVKTGVREFISWYKSYYSA